MSWDGATRSCFLGPIGVQWPVCLSVWASPEQKESWPAASAPNTWGELAQGQGVCSLEQSVTGILALFLLAP